MTDIATSSVLRKLVGNYRSKASAAAREDKILFPSEAKKLSPWARTVVAGLRRAGASDVTVNDYVNAHAQKIAAGLRALDRHSKDGFLSTAEAANARMPEFRTALTEATGSPPSALSADAECSNT